MKTTTTDSLYRANHRRAQRAYHALQDAREELYSVEAAALEERGNEGLHAARESLEELDMLIVATLAHLYAANELRHNPGLKPGV